MTEQQIIAGCLDNNRTAQRELYERYKHAMYTLAYRITGDFDEANDALQDTFLEVFKHLNQFRREATLGAWIKAILIRKAHRKKQLPAPWVLVEQLAEDSLNEDWLNEKIDAEKLEKLILGLPNGLRTVFVMVEVEGYTHHETAELLGISEGTSKSQLFHAKKKLRAALT